ncbi:pimeloyl-ACP methyl ester carboxylesterase [Nocardia transvalensis]|uniref:Pimeloyl-ACP methyl ester carboxylesterase n=1 Tax=Nocardia transvalensis TaxID=37333 RepID=A0A7W9PLR8_9NOCA|nr:alpha/beta hydrolase [Nocardia transvalensis]MBB5918411.1 pimeloyl-ACP methyl ester carboxylesterase [Nocardia transvalensis]
MPVFDYDGVSIAYDHAGSGDPILFLHNIGGDRTIWSEQFEAMRRTHSVYAMDLMGYGESDIPDSGYTVDNYLRLVSEFVASHRLRNLILVGHCFGSALSLLYARRNPQLVRALVLSSPLTAATLRPTPTGWTARAARYLPLDSLAGATRLPGPAASWVVREQLGPEGRSRGPEAVAGLRRRWSEPRRLLPAAAIARDLPRLAELDRFRPGPTFPPITTIWGEKNRILSPAAGARLNATLNPVESVTVPSCGHLVMLESPETVTTAIRSATTAALAS